MEIEDNGEDEFEDEYAEGEWPDCVMGVTYLTREQLKVRLNEHAEQGSYVHTIHIPYHITVTRP